MLRNRLRNLGREAMRLPRPDKSELAMTKSGGLIYQAATKIQMCQEVREWQ
jgi:hypothetical protein